MHATDGLAKNFASGAQTPGNFACDPRQRLLTKGSRPTQV